MTTATIDKILDAHARLSPEAQDIDATRIQLQDLGLNPTEADRLLAPRKTFHL